MINIIDLIKIILPILLGLLIGYEREYNEKPCGMRTVAIVCLGGSLCALVAYSIFGDPSIDIARLLYAPIIGIGFLGSGVIIVHKEGVEGITTAGVLWVMVIVGLLCGIGEFLLAIISTLAIYLILKLKFVKRKIEGNSGE